VPTQRGTVATPPSTRVPAEVFVRKLAEGYKRASNRSQTLSSNAWVLRLWVVTRFRRSSGRQFALIAGEAPNTETRLEALIKLEVACRLARESLPKLPAEMQEALREPVKTLCEVSGRELERLKPGVLDRGAGSS
jgi:hypothetical protein